MPREGAVGELAWVLLPAEALADVCLLGGLDSKD